MEISVLRLIRKRKGMTLRAVAKASGLSHPAVLQLEQGTLKSPVATAKVLAVYGIEGLDLLEKAGICNQCKGTGRTEKAEKLPRSLRILKGQDLPPVI